MISRNVWKIRDRTPVSGLREGGRDLRKENLCEENPAREEFKSGARFLSGYTFAGQGRSWCRGEKDV